MSPGGVVSNVLVSSPDNLRQHLDNVHVSRNSNFGTGWKRCVTVATGHGITNTSLL